MALEDAEPIDFGEATPFVRPRQAFKRQCSPEVRAFMSRAIRQLSDQPVNSSIEAPVIRFSIYGLNDRDTIIDALNSCPEAEYVKASPNEENENLIEVKKVANQELKAVRKYVGR